MLRPNHLDRLPIKFEITMGDIRAEAWKIIDMADRDLDFDISRLNYGHLGDALRVLSDLRQITAIHDTPKGA